MQILLIYIKKQQQQGVLQDVQEKTHLPPGHESYINNMKMLSRYVVK